MLTHEKFCVLHVPKTGGTQVAAALLAAVPDVSRADPLHGVLAVDLPAVVFVRHPLAWLVSFWGHARRSRADWAGMPLAGELTALARRELPAFVAAAGREKMASRIWSSYAVEGVEVRQCERWVGGLCAFLDGLSVPYSYDAICLSRGGTGQLKHSVPVSMAAELREADPAAFVLGGY